MDVYLYVSNLQEKLDFDYIEEQLKKLDAYDFEQTFRSIAFKMFGKNAKEGNVAADELQDSFDDKEQDMLRESFDAKKQDKLCGSFDAKEQDKWWNSFVPKNRKCCHIFLTPEHTEIWKIVWPTRWGILRVRRRKHPIK